MILVNYELRYVNLLVLLCEAVAFKIWFQSSFAIFVCNFRKLKRFLLLIHEGGDGSLVHFLFWLSNIVLQIII